MAINEEKSESTEWYLNLNILSAVVRKYLLSFQQKLLVLICLLMSIINNRIKATQGEKGSFLLLSYSPSLREARFASASRLISTTEGSQDSLLLLKLLSITEGSLGSLPLLSYSPSLREVKVHFRSKVTLYHWGKLGQALEVETWKQGRRTTAHGPPSISPQLRFVFNNPGSPAQEWHHLVWARPSPAFSSNQEYAWQTSPEANTIEAF